MSRPTLLLKQLAAATLIAGASGCSTLPTAPAVPDPSAGGTQVAATTVSAAGQARKMEPELSGGGTLASSGPGLTVSARISGRLGGVVTAGRFTVVFPPRATRGQPTLTITVPDTMVLACWLAISPPSANGFSVPVQLTARCAGILPARAMPGASISGYDPIAGQWIPVAGSDSDSVSMIVQAPLQRLSARYRVNAPAH